MKNMRELMNLMEGVETVPGINKDHFYRSAAYDNEPSGDFVTPHGTDSKMDLAAQGRPDDYEGPDSDWTEYTLNLLIDKIGFHKTKIEIQNAYDRGAIDEEKARELLDILKRNYTVNPEADFSLNEKSTSEKQARFMAAAAHNSKFAKKAGIDQGVAKEFNQADTGTKQLSNAMKHKKEESCVDMEEGSTPKPLDSRTADRLSKEISDRKWANQKADDEKDRQKQQQQQKPANESYQMEEMQEFSPDVQQALSDFENMVMNFFVEPEVAYDKIISNLEPESIDEFRSALEHTGMAYNDDYPTDISNQMNGGAESADNEYNDIPFEEAFDLNNGYDDINDASGNDFFPNGADSPVVNSTGPSGARQGDNAEQKKMQVAEVHKELVYGYRNFLKESGSKKK